MKSFVSKYVKKGNKVADVGSLNLNGSFKPLFEECDYFGLDIEEGPNVDIKVERYNFGNRSFDVVISGNTLEHVEDTRKWANEIIRICKKGGLICVIAPNKWEEHRFPIDCWRILPDGMRWLFREQKILECDMVDTDTFIIARRV